MGRSDVPLNDRGASQVQALAEVMKRLPLDAVYSSPQLRARQTADVVAEARAMKVEIAEALCEVDFPRWEGMSWEELETDELYQVYRKAPASVQHDGFEAIPKVLERTARFIEEIVHKNPNGRFALVSHADPLRTMISHLLRQPIEEFRRFRISNASLTIVGGNPDRWVMSLFNYRSGDEAVVDL